MIFFAMATVVAVRTILPADNARRAAYLGLALVLTLAAALLAGCVS